MVDEVKKVSKLNKRIIILISVVIAFVFIVLIIRPGLVGYSVYKEAERSQYTLDELGQSVRALRSELTTASSNLSFYASSNNLLQGQVVSLSQDYTSCEGERAQLEAQLGVSEQACNDKISLLEERLSDSQIELSELKNTQTAQIEDAKKPYVEDLSEVEAELLALQESYDELVSNTAKNVCCKKRVDDPAIDSYEVLANKVVCLEGGENVLVC